MKAGERVTLISKLAERLGREDYSYVDLCLEQFGFGSGGWEDWSMKEGILEHLKTGTDEALAELAEFLLGESKPPNQAEIEQCWPSGGFRLFLSHIAKHRAAAAELQASLAKYGIDAFVAHKDINPSAEWIDVIELALNTCDALAPILTDDFHTSKWTDQEVGYALRRRVLIVPIRIDVNPYGFMARYQALPAKGKAPSDVAGTIFQTLARNPLTAAKMAAALVNHFRASDSFAEARSNVQLLEAVTAWNPELLRSLEEAVESNMQVKGSWRVPEKVRAIIQRHGGQEPN